MYSNPAYKTFFGASHPLGWTRLPEQTCACTPKRPSWPKCMQDAMQMPPSFPSQQLNPGHTFCCTQQCKLQLFVLCHDLCGSTSTTWLNQGPVAACKLACCCGRVGRTQPFEYALSSQNSHHRTFIHQHCNTPSQLRTCSISSWPPCQPQLSAAACAA